MAPNGEAQGLRGQDEAHGLTAQAQVGGVDPADGESGGDQRTCVQVGRHAGDELCSSLLRHAGLPWRDPRLESFRPSAVGHSAHDGVTTATPNAARCKHVRDFDRLDWNLVPALNALLSELNVSRAARRLGVSQSAASGALARLRRHFDDELLVRRGNGYELSATGARLAPLARAAVDSTRNVLAATRSFDPAASTRVFEIASTEYGQIVLGSVLMARLAQAAPLARVTFRWPSNTAPSASDWLARFDGWLGPRDSMPGMPSSGMLEDRWVCVVDAGNTAVGPELTIGEVESHRWVVPTRPREHDVPWRQRLRAYGVELPIVASTESFAAVPFLVAGTARVGVVQHRLARRLAPSSGLRVVECPWSMVPLTLTLWWHGDREHDPGHAWLRSVIADCMDELDGLDDRAATDLGHG